MIDDPRAIETYEQIAKLAKHERRSLARMIKILLEDALAAIPGKVRSNPALDRVAVEVHHFDPRPVFRSPT